MSQTSLQSLFEAGAHFGHQTKQWSPKMAPFLYGKRAGIHIINLERTLEAVQHILPIMADIYGAGNKILFVGTKRVIRGALQNTAEKLGMPYVTRRWLGGTLTNYKTIRRLIQRVEELERQRETGFFEKLSKKEALMKTREIEKLNHAIGGIRNMGGLPDMLFVVDVDFEKIAVCEARRLGVPVVGFVDTNTDPNLVDFAVPINDDSAKALALILDDLSELCLANRKSAEMRAADFNTSEEAPATND